LNQVLIINVCFHDENPEFLSAQTHQKTLLEQYSISTFSIMHKHSEIRKSKMIPAEESDSDEEVMKTTKKTKSKVAHSSDSDDMTMSDTARPPKRNRGDISAIVKKRISQYREEEKGKDFKVPAGIQAERMKSRYEWLWNQIGDTGIPCKPNRKVKKVFFCNIWY
jgi:hypothetical protein